MAQLIECKIDMYRMGSEWVVLQLSLIFNPSYSEIVSISHRLTAATA